MLGSPSGVRFSSEVMKNPNLNTI